MQKKDIKEKRFGRQAMFRSQPNEEKKEVKVVVEVKKEEHLKDLIDDDWSIYSKYL